MEYYSETLRSYNEGLDIILEQLKDGEWVQVWSTNEMSNDYAYTDLKNKVSFYLKDSK